MDLNRYIINIPEGRTASGVFSRNTRFPVEDMLAFMIMPRTESTAVELSRFSEITGKETVCKQTFFMKRRQLSDGIFDEINRRSVDALYSSAASLKTWQGLYLMAFDGTTLKLPDTPDVAASFAKASNQHGESGQPLARMEVLKDVLNGVVLDVQIDTISATEPLMAVRTMESLPQQLKERAVFIFDRLYIGAAWFTWMHLHDIQYIIRMPRGFSKEVDAFFESEAQTADVTVRMSRSTWANKGRKSFVRFGLDPDTYRPVSLHLEKCTLDTGETEVLAVRIRDVSPSCREAYMLYGDRWGVETTIDEFKNQLQLEVFSGNTVLCVRQDVKAKVIAYNIGISLAVRATDSLGIPSDDTGPEEGSGEESRRRIKVNLNVGWDYIKEMIVRILVGTPDETERILTDTLKNLKRNLVEYELDRHLPHHTRSSTSGGKYVTFTNYKRAI